MKLFPYETKSYRFFAWWDIVTLFLKGICILGVLTGLVLYFLPDIDSNTAARVILYTAGFDFLCLAVLFFTNFVTHLFAKRTQWLFCAAGGLLILGITACVISTGFAAAELAGILFAVAAGILFLAYFILPNLFAVKDFATLVKTAVAEEAARKAQGFAAEAVYTAQK